MLHSFASNNTCISVNAYSYIYPFYRLCRYDTNSNIHNVWVYVILCNTQRVLFHTFCGLNSVQESVNRVSSSTSCISSVLLEQIRKQHIFKNLFNVVQTSTNIDSVQSTFFLQSSLLSV